MPFLRLLAALVAGIFLQWYGGLSFLLFFIFFGIGFAAYLSFIWLPAYRVFRFQWLRGVAVLVMLFACGGMLSYVKNPMHQKGNYTNVYRSGDVVVATVNEALLSKSKTYKANAIIKAIYHNKKGIPVSGTVIVYFSKEDIAPHLDYGSQIVFTKPLQKIINTGNPGSFDYNRFLLFQGITGQVFLKSDDYKILPQNNASSFVIFLNATRRYAIQTIQTFIQGKDEQSVAEALLIGYRNDLDKQLVMSYSKTGVVHIIAISGLHLGIIYGLILLLFSRFKNRKWYRFVVPVVALVILWIFTLIAGAVPSILRSAVTFSFIAAGMFINRKTNIYNTLAASAFCLLLFNPYLLWDVGFQLSYTAVLGIILFSKKIANCLYFQNKILNGIWQMTCVTLSAQILTLPVILYNFHQFPVLFLVTNLIVVPLSEIILFALLFLIVAGNWSLLASLAGKLAQSVLWLMNAIIIHTSRLSFSVIQNIKTDVIQAWLLYIIIVLLALWLLYKMPRLLLYSLAVAEAFFIYTSVDVYKASHQSKLIVYNINKHHVVDIISGKTAISFYDETLSDDIQSNNFYIKPCRTMFRISECNYQSLPAMENKVTRTNGKTIVFITKTFTQPQIKTRIKADIVFITNNVNLHIGDLVKCIDCPLIIADNNTSFYKINQWKQDCDSLHIRFYSIAQQGAFVENL